MPFKEVTFLPHLPPSLLPASSERRKCEASSCQALLVTSLLGSTLFHERKIKVHIQCQFFHLIFT